MNRHTFLVTMKYIATLGSIGYLPGAGSCATLVTLPIVALIKLLNVSYQTELYILLAITLVATAITHFALCLFPFTDDPRQIVIDEVVGCLWTFLGTAFTVKKMIWGFFFFRFFDISKTLGVRLCEKAPGAWGVMLDDILAGAYASLCLFLFVS